VTAARAAAGQEQRQPRRGLPVRAEVFKVPRASRSRARTSPTPPRLFPPQAVPRAIAGCTSLEVLLLAGNRLRGLTSGIGHCQALQVVDLESNAYRHLPAPLGTLMQLRVS
jgi:hypothetical protein